MNQKGEKNNFFGKHHSKETKRKIGNANREHTISDETRKKMRESHWGKNHTENEKQKISKALTGRKLSEETKRKLSKSHSGEKHPNFGKHRSESTKNKLRITSKRNWENEEIVKKIFVGFHPNGKELYLDFLLQNYFPDEWKFVGDGQVTIGGLCPDFINVNDKKKIIELFGDYWHNKKNMRYHQTEKGRKKAYEQVGYSTLVIWEHELIDKNKVTEKIKLFIKK